MTLKNNRVHLLCYLKLCASLRSHWWIQTGVTVRKRPNWVKINDFMGRVTLKCDGWPWKAIGHLFFATSNCMHHFIAISVFKLELQSRNARFGSKATILSAAWPWNLMENKRAPLLSNIKLYASFHDHLWIQTAVTVRKRLSCFFTSVTLTFDRWPWLFAWTSFLSLVITSENFVIIRWWEHSEKGVTDRQTDRRTDGLNHS